ncbi:MAG: hypothetical protein EZS28_034403 [Streblomastix strix]|uniref:Uncharacterized protein n=1 Tax=Streblomastix strix TaxID=222440 RepID=A0A5J4UJ33_9EUKA|nr:MAG: hypothetical protein EZS28_034403 [Streblomastix strix]
MGQFQGQQIQNPIQYRFGRENTYKRSYQSHRRGGRGRRNYGQNFRFNYISGSQQREEDSDQSIIEVGILTRKIAV